MKMWKNITIELPKLDLEYLSNELFNLDIISVLIEKKNKPNKSNWFDDGINPLKYDHRSHKISVLIDGVVLFGAPGVGSPKYDHV